MGNLEVDVRATRMILKDDKITREIVHRSH